ITALVIVFAFLASVFVLPSLLVVWARFAGYDVQAEMESPHESGFTDVSSHERVSHVTNGDHVRTVSDEGPLHHEPLAFRAIERSYPLPDQSVPVTVTLRGVEGRVSLRETVSSDIEKLEVSPDPIAVDRHAGTVTVFWDIESPQSEATISYTVALSDGADDGDELRFEGVLEDEEGRHSIEGDETATVVTDVFQRVLERGFVTDADLALAAEREDVAPTELDRLRRAWLDDD
ncbi:MAG: hypothetical protein V5A21_03515, partial [Halapricum sp.]